ncbi:hypothetical protein, partial [Klebsiella pneumoniae]|uniref:hypothetical protein n=1 Tax=Klebsiella pneumoniae TaxID=573 RepID=UPI00200F9216
NGGKNSLNRLIRCVCGKKIGPDPRNFNQRVSLGRNDLLIRTFLNRKRAMAIFGSSIKKSANARKELNKDIHNYIPDGKSKVRKLIVGDI